jgi:molybdate transport system substrate-binding protein
VTRALLAGVLLAALTACAGEGDDERTLTVLAAASLTDAFERLGAGFEAEHEGVEVDFSFGSSTELAAQAADGAPGDVLATADAASMRIAGDAGVAGEPAAFANNTLVLVTPPDDPAGVDTLDDLAGTAWVRCADEVPCGRVALDVLADEGVTAEPVSLEEDVRAALEKVTSGEADAGLVYATDAVAAGDAVRTVPLPGADRHATSYLLAALDQAEHPDLAAAWLDHVLSADGRAALDEAGFASP